MGRTMTRMIQAHGFNFAIEQNGFLRNNAMDDYESIVQAIEDKLASMPENEVAALHMGALIDDETQEPRDEKTAHALYSLADSVASEALQNWHDPSAAFVMISATP